MSLQEAVRIYERGIELIEEDMSLEKLLLRDRLKEMKVQTELDLNQQRCVKEAEITVERLKEVTQLRIIDLWGEELSNDGLDRAADYNSVSDKYLISKSCSNAQNQSTVQMITFDSLQQNNVEIVVDKKLKENQENRFRC